MALPVRSADPAGARSLVDALLRPASVALIGASANPDSLAGRPVRLLADHGYPGRIYPVNPGRTQVQGLAAYPSVTDVPEPVDVALVMVRADRVPGVLRECAASGVRVAVVMSSGFGEGMGGGTALREEITRLVGGPMRILGPNCEGIASLPAAAPLSFSPVLDAAGTGVPLRTGPVAVVSQSGGLGFAVVQWGSQVGLGFDYVVTTGNEIDVDALEVIEALVEDGGTSVVVAMIEEFRDPERFARVASRFAEQGKRLVVAKLGRSTPGARGALAHTGHDAGDADAYRRLFAEHGITQAGDEEELVDVVQALAKCRPMAGRRVAILTTSGGAGVWLADACVEFGLDVPVLSAATQAELASRIPKFGSPVNPVDLTAQFVAGGRFAPAIETVLRSGEVDGVVLATSLAAPGRLAGDREGLAELRGRYPHPIAVYTYTKPAQPSVDLLAELRLPWYASARRAARGVAALVSDEKCGDQACAARDRRGPAMPARRR